MSALATLEKHAQWVGANAVVNIVSYYKKVEMASATSLNAMSARFERLSRSGAILSKLPIHSQGEPSATLWLLNSSCVSGQDLDFFVQRLSASERCRYAGFARRERQRQFLLGRTLLRVAIARVTGLSPYAFDVIERPSDAPQLTFPAGPCSIPYFSLSHSGEWIGCAISSSARLGLDIEVVDPTRDILAGGRIAFHSEEHAWLLRQSDSTRLSAFYELWCSREALYKLQYGLESQRHLAPLITAGVIADSGCTWRRYSLPRSGLVMIICSDRKLAAIEQVELNGFTRRDWVQPE